MMHQEHRIPMQYASIEMILVPPLGFLEENNPWYNKAELYIGIIKQAVRKDMKESNCPLAFWDYCMQRRSCINNLTAKYLFILHGSNAHTFLTGDEETYHP